MRAILKGKEDERLECANHLPTSLSLYPKFFSPHIYYIERQDLSNYGHPVLRMEWLENSFNMLFTRSLHACQRYSFDLHIRHL